MFDEEYTYENWISQFRTLTKLEEQLKFIITIINSLNADVQKEFYDDLVDYEKIWKDDNFMRKVKLRDSIISEFATEYYGKDYGEDDVFKYQPKLEKKINELSLGIMATLGRVIKYLKESDSIIGDET